jgi:hypothetical protein
MDDPGQHQGLLASEQADAMMTINTMVQMLLTGYIIGIVSVVVLLYNGGN